MSPQNDTEANNNNASSSSEIVTTVATTTVITPVAPANPQSNGVASEPPMLSTGASNAGNESEAKGEMVSAITIMPNGNSSNADESKKTVIEATIEPESVNNTASSSAASTAAMAESADAKQQQQQQHDSMMESSKSKKSKGKMDNDAGLTNFKVLYVVTQLCGLTMIVLMGSWVGVHFGGVGGPSNPSLEFNWHPILMTIGLIFLYGNSILIYRGFRTTRKKTLKITHAAIHMGAFVLTVIALKTVFDSHNLAPTPIPNMYSLHSWLGLSSVILFCMQYVCGFLAYMVPGLKQSYKVAYMPLHIYFGVFAFVLAIASALMGITEKAIFAIKDYSSLPNAGVMANVIGVLYVVFGGLVVYLVTEPSYKRKPLPEDTILLTGASE